MFKKKIRLRGRIFSCLQNKAIKSKFEMKQTPETMKTLEGVTLNLEFQVGLLDNSRNYGPQYEDDWGRKCHHSLLNYWEGICSIRERSGDRCVFFMLVIPSSLRKEDVPGNENYQGTNRIVEGKSGLGLMESIFQFKDWQEGDSIANEPELNEVYAQTILDKLGLELSNRVNLPFKWLDKVIWIDTKPLLDKGVITRPNYQMEMLAGG